MCTRTFTMQFLRCAHKVSPKPSVCCAKERPRIVALQFLCFFLHFHFADRAALGFSNQPHTNTPETPHANTYTNNNTDISVCLSVHLSVVPCCLSVCCALLSVCLVSLSLVSVCLSFCLSLAFFFSSLSLSLMSLVLSLPLCLSGFAPRPPCLSTVSCPLLFSLFSRLSCLSFRFSCLSSRFFFSRLIYLIFHLVRHRFHLASHLCCLLSRISSCLSSCISSRSLL